MYIFDCVSFFISVARCVSSETFIVAILEEICMRIELAIILWRGY